MSPLPGLYGGSLLDGFAVDLLKSSEIDKPRHMPLFQTG